ncbi:BON1-associated-like protein, partial [Trifolium medium]|nr:BON1-associated-like protein [Trifolium medium]
SITFEVQCKKFKSVRPIGVARIAVVDLLNIDESKICMPFFSYRLRDWEGRQNGVINFCVKEVEKRSGDLPEKKMAANGKNYGD